MGGKVFRQPDKMYYSKYGIPLLCFIYIAEQQISSSNAIHDFLPLAMFFHFLKLLIKLFGHIDQRLCRVTPATLIKMFEREWFPLLNPLVSTVWESRIGHWYLWLFSDWSKNLIRISRSGDEVVGHLTSAPVTVSLSDLWWRRSVTP